MGLMFLMEEDEVEEDGERGQGMEAGGGRRRVLLLRTITFFPMMVKVEERWELG